MKERPILFSAPMVCALLAGQKTQTRRIVKPRKDLGFGCLLHPNELAGEVNNGSFENSPWSPGDRLWVRENGWQRPERTPKMMREGADTWASYYYDADGCSGQDRADFKQQGFKRRPSIHMPRWACRIMLEIVSVRVELLQDISESDAIAEGVTSIWDDRPSSDRGPNHYTIKVDSVSYNAPTARDVYSMLWDQINGAGAWDANPWVWAIEFNQVKP